MDVLMSEMESIAELLTQFDAGEIFFADDAQQKNELWKIRRKANEAAVMAGYTIEEDTVVPRAELPILLNGVKLIGKKYGFKSLKKISKEGATLKIQLQPNGREINLHFLIHIRDKFLLSSLLLWMG